MKKHIEGPYRVIKDGTYRVVFMLDDQTNHYREIDGSRTYTDRSNAYRRCRFLNTRWNEEHKVDAAC